MGTAFYKTWELLIWKSFCIDQTADSKSGRKDMDFFDLAPFRYLLNSSGLITDPIDIHLFTRDSVYGH